MTKGYLMALFQFRLEQVLQYRKQIEDIAKQRLAEVTAQRDATKKKIKELQTALKEQRQRRISIADSDPGQRWIEKEYEKVLYNELEVAHVALEEQELLVDQAMQDLVVKAQERNLLEKLKEKQLQRYMLQERLNEQRVNDETATLRFTHASF